jgi:two-component system NtrC family response regulator
MAMENKRKNKIPCIVIAEDDKEMRSLLYYYLSKFGYEIVLCKDGNELISEIGKNLIDEEKYIDLIITDIRMPHASGLKILKQLKPNLVLPPVIVITAFGSEEIHQEARKYGASEVFDKPFDIDSLLLKIEQLVPSYPFNGNHNIQ